MSMTTESGRSILTPEDVLQLLVKPLETESIPGRVATAVSMSGNALRIPIVQQDPAAGFINEGAEIPASDAVFSEAKAEARKIAGLTIISRELAEDSSPAAAEEVGRGLVRDIRRKVDRAFVLDLAAPAPAGLGSLENVTVIAAGASWMNTDPMIDATAAAASAGAALSHWVVSAADLVSIRKLKTSTGSNQALVTPDAGGGLMLEGLPVVVSPDLAPGTAYGVDSSRIVFGIREDASVVSDSSVFFTSDRVAVRATMRLTWAFPHEESIVKIAVTP